MAEPTSTGSLSLVAIGIAVFGTALGPAAAVVLATLAGALYSTSRYETASKAGVVWILLRIMLVTLTLTGAVLWVIERTTGWSSMHLIPIVAFVISLFYDKWPEWGEKYIVGFLTRRGGRDAS